MAVPPGGNSETRLQYIVVLVNSVIRQTRMIVWSRCLQEIDTLQSRALEACPHSQVLAASTGHISHPSPFKAHEAQSDTRRRDSKLSASPGASNSVPRPPPPPPPQEFFLSLISFLSWETKKKGLPS